MPAVTIGIQMFLLVGALVLSAFAVILKHGKDPLGWAVLFLASALLLS